MRYLSENKAIEWLNKHATFGDKNISFNRKKMKDLDKTCRLMPAKSGLFGKKYSLLELRGYARDMKPRL